MSTPIEVQETRGLRKGMVWWHSGETGDAGEPRTFVLGGGLALLKSACFSNFQIKKAKRPKSFLIFAILTNIGPEFISLFFSKN